MLKRVLEPEVMDSPAEALDYDRMDHREVNRAFVTDLLAALAGTAVSGEVVDVLDIGIGTAQIPIELCGGQPAFRVTGIDLAATMLHLARANVEVAGLTGRVRLDLVDAKSLPYEDGHFHVVMSNSIVHHIPEPCQVVREAVRVLGRGGLLFVRDLARPADDATVERLVSTYAARANEHQRQLFDQSLRAALSLDEARDVAAAAGLSPGTVKQTSDRHWTLAAGKSLAD
jgi:ubiquinone/menaquinone biosynthesis C-methylase UbiE